VATALDTRISFPARCGEVTSGSVERRSEVVAVALLGFAHVHRHPHPHVDADPWLILQRNLRRQRRTEGVAHPLEGGGKGVAAG
jgi:hypothetical protein